MNITNHQQEILDILTEECQEVIQVICKIRRFGLDSCHPDNPEYSNHQHLLEELGDVACMIDLVLWSGLGFHDDLNRAKRGKMEKLKRFSRIFDKKELQNDL